MRHSVCTLLVCCSALWVVCASFSRVRPSPPPPPLGCDATLMFSSEVSSSSEGNGNIHDRSLSPWTWRSSTVMNRIPSTIWEAECSTNSSCSSPIPGETNKHNLYPRPIQQNILVLHRQGKGRCYNASFQTVVVGCTCVWAKTNQN